MPFMKRTIDWLLDRMSPDMRIITFLLVFLVIAVTPFIAGGTILLWMFGVPVGTAALVVSLTIFGVPLYLALVGHLGCKGNKK